MKKLILVILDGWGIANNKAVSAIDQAKTPNFNRIYSTYQHSKLQASGLAVGLPEGQMGNSEVGHMNIGAGRVVFQDLVRINLEAQNGNLANHPLLAKAMNYAKANKKKIHILGLVSDGGVHAHINHAKALCDWAANNEWQNLYIHAFTDGRDTDPKSGFGFIQELISYSEKTAGKVVSLIGRYYSMDRDKRWERVKLAYDSLVLGKGKVVSDILEGISQSYEEGVTDEFIKPIILSGYEKEGRIEEGDVVINFNFRTDRGRQITEVLTQADFPEFDMHKLNLHYITMARYDDSFKGIEVLYEKDNLHFTLGETIATDGLKQIRIAETEKYPHVTFFFNGGREQPFQGESRIMCPSPKVATYDLKPEMSARDIVKAIVPEMDKKEASFICLNFANPDMVGHTGVFSAAVKACETVDECLGEILESASQNDYAVLVIADHGNSDFMINEDGSPNTAHTTALVPCIFVEQGYELTSNGRLNDGKLGDLAPTILHYLGLNIPAEMTGNILFSKVDG